MLALFETEILPTRWWHCTLARKLFRRGADSAGPIKLAADAEGPARSSLTTAPTVRPRALARELSRWSKVFCMLVDLRGALTKLLADMRRWRFFAPAQSRRRSSSHDRRSAVLSTGTTDALGRGLPLPQPQSGRAYWRYWRSRQYLYGSEAKLAFGESGMGLLCRRYSRNRSVAKGGIHISPGTASEHQEDCGEAVGSCLELKAHAWRVPQVRPTMPPGHAKSGPARHS